MYDIKMIKTFPDLIILLSGLYHFVAGIFVLGPKSWALFFAKNTYQLNIPSEYEPRYEITLKFLGLMAIALSFHLFTILLIGPKEIKIFSLIILGTLFIARAFLRIQYKQKIYDAYQLSFDKSKINIVFNITIGIASILSILLY
jgi:hypothetical protein